MPFLEEDGIVVDPLLLWDDDALNEAVAHQLAHLLDPRWSDPPPEDPTDREVFACALGPVLRAAPPEQANGL